MRQPFDLPGRDLAIGRPCRAVTPTIVAQDKPTMSSRRLRYKLVRDAGAAMSTPIKFGEQPNYYLLTKIDGTYVDSRNESPAGITYSITNGIASFLIDNTLLPANETVFVDFIMGEDLGV